MWRHELKHDGWRLQILKDGSDITLLSKNGHDLTRRFRTVADAARTLKARHLEHQAINRQHSRCL